MPSTPTFSVLCCMKYNKCSLQLKRYSRILNICTDRALSISPPTHLLANPTSLSLSSLLESS